jgi:hypothetical protein
LERYYNAVQMQRALDALGVVVHPCNVIYSGDRDPEDHGSRPVVQKVSKTPFQKISQAWWLQPVIPAMGEL